MARRSGQVGYEEVKGVGITFGFEWMFPDRKGGLI